MRKKRTETVANIRIQSQNTIICFQTNEKFFSVANFFKKREKIFIFMLKFAIFRTEQG